MQLTAYMPVDLLRLLHWFDIFAVVVFAVSGALVASRKRLDVMGFMWLAVVTGVGGIIRDRLGQVPSVLLRHEIYVTASVLGACTYVGLYGIGASRPGAMVAGFLVTFVLRSLAIAFGWSLPAFRPRL